MAEMIIRRLLPRGRHFLFFKVLKGLKWRTCMSLFLLLSTKDDILENVGKQTLVPIDFHGREDWNLYKSMGTSNCLDANVLQNILFYVQQNKKGTTLV